MSSCLAIKVGPSWHAVEDCITGVVMQSLALTEQCDNCGGPGRFTRLMVNPTEIYYACDTCNSRYPVSVRSEEECVWS